MGMLSDHQDTNLFSYNRSWDDIESMLEEAEKELNKHHIGLTKYKGDNQKKAIYHARNYKALQGVVKTLRWTLGDKNISHPLE